MSVKRYEWVACDEHSCHCDVVESAEGDMVDYEDYAALEARCAALAAENAGLKDSVEHAAGCIAAAEAEGLIDSLDEKDGERLADLIHRRLCHAYLPVKTPATDAFLAEVRAQGVEMFSEQQRSFIGKPSKNDAASSYSSREAINFADQLRKGAAS